MTTTTVLDPRIGILRSGPRDRFYCYPNGHHRPEVIGTREEVECALGLRPRPAAAGRVRPVRSYEVTVTPRLVVYADRVALGAYTVEVAARSHAEAVSRVRAQRRDEEGRFAVPADYRARIVR